MHFYIIQASSLKHAAFSFKKLSFFIATEQM